jgi:hypothetical protein
LSWSASERRVGESGQNAPVARMKGGTAALSNSAIPDQWRAGQLSHMPCSVGMAQESIDRAPSTRFCGHVRTGTRVVRQIPNGSAKRVRSRNVTFCQVSMCHCEGDVDGMRRRDALELHSWDACWDATDVPTLGSDLVADPPPAWPRETNEMRADGISPHTTGIPSMQGCGGPANSWEPSPAGARRRGVPV